MAELHDPDQPAGALIEVRDDGSALRNDGVELTPAGQNPWYVLATVYGEYYENGYDPELAARNRRIWNGWACAGKSDKEQAALAQKVGLPVEDLADLTKEERQAIEHAFAERLGGSVGIPDNDEAIDMSEIHFPNTVVLEKWIFSRDASFASASFRGDAYFHSATFRGRADFSNRMFDGQTVFSHAKFLGDVPKFYQRSFHQDTEFSLDQTNWPLITKDNAAESKRAYTRLRQVMNELHKPDDEHFFYRQEMRCKALLENIWNRWPFVLFRWMSDYGYSVTRPIAWLAAVVVLGGAVIGSYLRTTGIPGNGSIWQGLGVSFSNTFPFLGFSRKMHPDFFEIAPAWLDALSAAQSILGVILLFFLGLGLRNRFRIK